MDRTRDCGSRNRGSNPRGGTKKSRKQSFRDFKYNSQDLFNEPNI